MTLEVFPPHLEVEGVGRIALPLLPLQAEQLVTVAEHAPYGRGQETIVDTQVRRTWQIDANRVTLRGMNSRICRACCARLSSQGAQHAL